MKQFTAVIFLCISFVLKMEKVEEDLSRSKNLREKQAKEFSRQLDELKIKHEKEVSCSFCVSHFLVSLKQQGDPSSQTPQETSMKSTRAQLC